MGRNKACELDNLLIEAIIMVAEFTVEGLYCRG